MQLNRANARNADRRESEIAKTMTDSENSSNETDTPGDDEIQAFSSRTVYWRFVDEVAVQ
jgi:hypothetical protein